MTDFKVAAEELWNAANDVLKQTVLTGREDGFHYTIPYGVEGCLVLENLKRVVDKYSNKK